MITTGLIKEINLSNGGYTSNTFLVELPIFNSTSTDANTKTIVEATACLPGGIYDCYNIGDYVYVGFINNKYNYPVILGKIYKGLDNSLSGAFKPANLEVTKKVTLPKDIQIGDLNYNDLIKLDINKYVTVDTDQEIKGNKSFSQPVGIGINTPEEKLHVVGNIMLSGSTSSSPEIIFKRGTYTDNYNDWKIVDEGGSLKFYDRNGNSGWRFQFSLSNDAGILGGKVYFSTPSSISDISSGDTLPTLFGKIKTWYPNLMNMRSRLEALEYIEGLSNPQIGEESYLSLKSNILQPTVMIDDVSYNIVDNVRTSISRSKGNTKKFNQLVRNGNIEDSGNYIHNYSDVYGNYTISNNVLTYICSTDRDIYGNQVYFDLGTNINPTHIYFVCVTVSKTASAPLYIRFSNSTEQASGTNMHADSNGVFTFVGTPQSSSNVGARLYFGYYTKFTDVQSFSISKIMVIDLTAIGLENISISDFTALYPKAYYPYNPGTLYDSVISGLQLKDVDQTTVTGTISLPSTQTLGGVGTAQDEIQVIKNTNNDYYTIKKIQRVASVDLGTRTWQRFNVQGTTKYLFATQISGMDSSRAKILSNSNYTIDNTAVISTLSDLRMMSGPSVNYIYLRDDSFSDVSTFKSSLSGVMLTYELATPVETTLTETATLAEISAIRENGGMISVLGNTNEDYAQPDIGMSVVYNSPALI